jgi:hypothetical protein
MVSQSEMHAPDDLLALHAMGDPLPEAMTRHVASCAQCRSEVDQWASVIATGRTASPADTPRAAPDRVWDAIAADLGLTETRQPGRATVERQAEVVSLDRARRRWSTSWLVAASVAGVVGGAVLTAGGVALDDSGSDPAPVAAPPVVATASLAALPKHQGGGAAEIVQGDSGKELVVDVSDLSGGEGFYEVWLIDPETFQMVGLGALTAESGRFPIPDGLDLSQYTVVDVSLEPLDGDPVHSRDSVVRGELAT